MSDSFLHNHQAALDSQREDDAINDLKNGGIYPDPQNDYCSKCDCILRYDEKDVCCSCEELEDKHYPMETDYD